MPNITDDPKAEPLAAETETMPLEGEIAIDEPELEVASNAGADQTGDELSALRAQNAALKEQAARALADYQNLERHVREQRAKTIDVAKIAILESLLQPLEHLRLAAAALKDQGLDMVVSGRRWVSKVWSKSSRLASLLT